MRPSLAPSPPPLERNNQFHTFGGSPEFVSPKWGDVTLDVCDPKGLHYPPPPDGATIASMSDQFGMMWFVILDWSGNLTDCNGRGQGLTTAAGQAMADDLSQQVYALNGFRPDPPALDYGDYWSVSPYGNSEDSDPVARAGGQLPFLRRKTYGADTKTTQAEALEDPWVRDVFLPFPAGPPDGWPDGWEGGYRCTVNVWSRFAYPDYILGRNGGTCINDKVQESMKQGLIGSIEGFLKGFVAGGWIGAVVGAVVGGVQGHISGYEDESNLLKQLGAAGAKKLSEPGHIGFQPVKGAFGGLNPGEGPSIPVPADPCSDWWRRLIGC